MSSKIFRNSDGWQKTFANASVHAPHHIAAPGLFSSCVFLAAFGREGLEDMSSSSKLLSL